MRSLLACTVLVLAVGVIYGEECICKYGGGPQKPSTQLRDRMDEHAARMSRISVKIQDMDDKLSLGKEKALGVVEGHKSMKIRLRRLEDKECPNYEFFCGRDEGRCVSSLLVCDGHKDCHNGKDEDEKQCKSPVQAGTEFKGNIYMVDLCTARKPHTISFIITSTREVPFYTPHLHVKANLILHSDFEGVEGHAALPVEGHYCFSRRRLLFYPPEDDRLAFACEFDPSDYSTCEATILHEQSGEPCLEFPMTKV